jgi:hypothetical protein
MSAGNDELPETGARRSRTPIGGKILPSISTPATNMISNLGDQTDGQEKTENSFGLFGRRPTFADELER